MNIFQLYHLLISATVHVLVMGEERLTYKVDASDPISSRLCPSLGEDTIAKGIIR